MKTYKSNIVKYRLVKEPTDIPKVKITNHKDAVEYVRQFWDDTIGVYESMYLLVLNRQNITVGYVKISQGGVNGTVIDTKLVVKYCSDALANACILFHNHPSGQLEASGNDISITNKAKKALKYIDCTLLDHIIITEDDHKVI